MSYIILCVSCATNSSIERQQFVMGTTARVIVDEGSYVDAGEALNVIKKMDDLLSDYKPESEISRINDHAGVASVLVSSEVTEILDLTLKVAEETQGAFDPTIGALTIDLYRFGRKNSRIPSDDEIERARSLVSFRDLVIDKNTVLLKRKGMKIDLGGIGKGYAIDKAVSVLKMRGVTSGLVSLSGDIRVFGKDLRIGIQNPFGNGNIATFLTGKNDISISTSGDYRRFLEKKGRKVHHLLVPEKGAPSKDFSSITVIMSGSSALADAYSTAIFVMGKEKSLKFVSNRKDFGVFIVFKNGEVFHSKSFKNMVKNFKLEKTN